MSYAGKLVSIAAISAQVIISHESSAAVYPIKPETRATIPEKPLERETVVVPCLRIPERNRSSWWMLIGPNGEVFIIGERTVRQRC